MVLGERVKLVREMAGLTARGLDRLVGVAEGYTSLIESGKRRNIGSDLLSSYAEKLGASLDWLISGKGAAPAKATVVAAMQKAKGRAA